MVWLLRNLSNILELSVPGNVWLQWQRKPDHHKLVYRRSWNRVYCALHLRMHCQNSRNGFHSSQTLIPAWWLELDRLLCCRRRVSNFLNQFGHSCRLIEILPNMPNLRALRTLRVLRPLRSINAIPSMRRLINSLIESLPALANVVIFLLFVFLLFGILGV